MNMRLARWGLLVLVALTPTLATYALITLRLNARLTDFIPAWIDEVAYWHQTRTWLEVGLQGGYYSIYELPPAVSFLHFYTYGPWYAIIYGAVAGVTGWALYSGVVINLILVGMALAVFGWALRLDSGQLLLLSVVTLTFWPSLLYLMSNMQESLQQVIATLLALIFSRALTQGSSPPRRWYVASLVFIALASVLRVSWAMLYIPFFMLTGQPTWRGWLLAFVKSALLTAGALLFAAYTGAPGNNAVFDLLGSFGLSVGDGITTLWNAFYHNLLRYFALDKFPLDAVQTSQVIGLLTVFAGVTVRLSVRRGPVKPGTLTRAESGFHLVNIGMIVLASLALYLVGTWGDYRVIAAHLFLTVLILVAFRRYWLVGLFVLSNVVVLPMFLTTYTDFNAAKFRLNRAVLDEVQATAQRVLYYDRETPNPYCNTLLLSVSDYTYVMNGVPGGIGLSFFVWADDRRMTFKSHYFFLAEGALRLIRSRPDTPELDLLAMTSQGNFYRNPNAGCAYPATQRKRYNGFHPVGR